MDERGACLYALPLAVTYFPLHSRRLPVVFCPRLLSSLPPSFSCLWCIVRCRRGGSVQHNDSDVPLHQMTASAVGNMPEKDLDAVKEMVIRGVMHADERLFAFKVSERALLLLLLLLECKYAYVFPAPS